MKKSAGRRLRRVVSGLLAMIPGFLVITSTPAAAANPEPSLTGALHRLTTTPNGPPGAVAIIQVGKSTQTIVTGRGDVATGAPPSGNDLMRIASVAKAFNGAVALAMVHQGMLSLSDTIGGVLPSLPKAWGVVTLAEMLQHTGGLPDYTKNPDFIRALQADPQQTLSPAQLVDYVASEPLSFRPGAKYEYSDTDNIVVGLMIEAVSHEPYEQALARFVLNPLHLTHSALPTTSSLPGPYLHGYQNNEGQQLEDVSTVLNPALAWASGGMVSTPLELNMFMRAYASGQLVGKAIRASQFKFRAGSSGPPGPGTNAAGLAIFRYQTRCGTVYGHTGNFPGYTQFAAATQDGRRSVVVSVNEQLSTTVEPKTFRLLRTADELAVCEALTRR